ncbi:hsp90-like protein [Hymenopellis radicata]|nr:hsp90-like protein [Hymenopellis radicata]
MPLNYSKWDQLELSDDSDIEGHPNVDKKSLIRWKQRDIHEKREQRKAKIAHLHAQIDCNKVIQVRINEIHATLTSPSTASPTDCPPGNDPSKLEHTYDGMILSLLTQVSAQAKDKVKDASVLESERDEKLVKALIDGITFHKGKLAETIAADVKEVDAEEKEQKKHITSEDMHDGFSTHYVPPKETPTSVPTTKIEKPKKQIITEFETLNPQASASTSSATTQPQGDDDDNEMPELTPSLEAFSKLPLGGYEQSFRFIQAHPDVVVDGAADALLIAGFRAEGDGKSKYAKQCVHQSLLLQYCEKLGRDGVRVFFSKMISGDKRAVPVFVEDMNKTYSHLKERVLVTQAEERASAEGKEQIQLVPESADQTISFNVPDGPPPEELVYEGPDADTIDIEEVRKALQLRWDVFDSFEEDLKEALKSNSLDKVNVVLGEMDVPTAEDVVNKLDMGGILNFASGGIRDETGRNEEE